MSRIKLIGATIFGVALLFGIAAVVFAFKEEMDYVIFSYASFISLSVLSLTFVFSDWFVEHKKERDRMVIEEITSKIVEKLKESKIK